MSRHGMQRRYAGALRSALDIAFIAASLTFLTYEPGTVATVVLLSAMIVGAAYLREDLETLRSSIAVRRRIRRQLDLAS